MAHKNPRWKWGLLFFTCYGVFLLFRHGYDAPPVWRTLGWVSMLAVMFWVMAGNRPSKEAETRPDERAG